MSKTPATKSVTLKLINSADISKRIAAMRKSGTKLQNEMHLIACSVLACFGENNDVRKATNFVLEMASAMPEMSRVNALKQWFEAHAPIRFATPDEIKAGAPAAVYVKGGKYRLGDAMATPFWKFKAKEGVEYKAVDIHAEIKRLLAKIETHNKGAVENNTQPIDAGIVNALSMLQAGVLPASTATVQ